MNKNTEAVIFFLPIIISILVTIFYAIGGREMISKKSFIKMSIANFVILFLGGYLWLGIGDGVAVLVGSWIYAGIFVFIEIILSLILYFVSKQSKKL